MFSLNIPSFHKLEFLENDIGKPSFAYETNTNKISPSSFPVAFVYDLQTPNLKIRHLHVLAELKSTF